MDLDPGLLKLENVVLEKKLRETETKLYYVLADLENVRKREDLEIENRALAAEATAFLPILAAVDDLEKVLQQAPEGVFKQGLSMVVSEFRDALRQAGVEEVPGVGSLFDPMLHEAVGEEEANLPPSTIAVELRKGYTLRGRLIRPAIVKVSRPRPQAPGEGGKDVTAHRCFDAHSLWVAGNFQLFAACWQESSDLEGGDELPAEKFVNHDEIKVSTHGQWGINA